VRWSGLLADSFFEGAKELVEFEKLFVHVERLVLELLDFLGAVGEDEGEGWVRRRWRELRGCNCYIYQWLASFSGM
jgi:hypothetical protein